MTLYGKIHVTPSDVASSIQQGLPLASTFDMERVENFRRVHSSICYESDNLLGRILLALDQNADRDAVYVIMLSDHEDAIELCIIRKSYMYDSGFRVMILLSGSEWPLDSK